MKRTPSKPAVAALKRDVGASYPLYAIDEAMKIADAVRELGGSRTPVSKSLLAKTLKYAETGPSFFQRVGAAKSFGIIEGWGSYSLTDQGKKYYFPATPSEKKQAALFFLSTPAVFSLIVKRFDGEKLPANEMVGNIMHNEAQIPPSWKDRLAGLFMRSAKFLGVMDAEGFLRCKAYLEEGGGTDPDPDPPPPPAPPLDIDPAKGKNIPPVPQGYKALVIPLDARSGRNGTLYFPEDLDDNKEVRKLIDFIKLSFDYDESKVTNLRKEDSQ